LEAFKKAKITTDEAKIIQGSEANKTIACYYNYLFKGDKSATNTKLKSDSLTEEEVENSIAKISTGKAMSVDMFPDDLIQDDKAFDSIIREEAYSQLRQCGVTEEGP